MLSWPIDCDNVGVFNKSICNEALEQTFLSTTVSSASLAIELGMTKLYHFLYISSAFTLYKELFFLISDISTLSFCSPKGYKRERLK